MSAPKISVVMTVYNAAAYVDQAIGSILSQTFRDFEFIIIDDGSTDDTPSKLASFASADDRIAVHTNETNLSVPESTNRGFAAARGEYIARMDGDDIAAPSRLAKQVAFLDNFADVVVVGAGFQEIDCNGKVRKTDCEFSSDAILQWRALFRMPLLHSSLMFRRSSILNGNLKFDRDFDGAADFEFTQRLFRTGKAAIIPQPLMQYRMHPQNVSTRKKQKQHDAARRASIKETMRQIPDMNADGAHHLFRYLHADGPASARETSFAGAAMQDMQRAFAERRNLTPDEIQQQASLATRWIVMAILRRQRTMFPIGVFQQLLAAKRNYLTVLSEAGRYLGKRMPRHDFREFSPVASQK